MFSDLTSIIVHLLYSITTTKVNAKIMGGHYETNYLPEAVRQVTLLLILHCFLV